MNALTFVQLNSETKCEINDKSSFGDSKLLCDLFKRKFSSSYALSEKTQVQIRTI